MTFVSAENQIASRTTAAHAAARSGSARDEAPSQGFSALIETPDAPRDPAAGERPVRAGRSDTSRPGDALQKPQAEAAPQAVASADQAPADAPVQPVAAPTPAQPVATAVLTIDDAAAVIPASDAAVPAAADDATPQPASAPDIVANAVLLTLVPQTLVQQTPAPQTPVPQSSVPQPAAVPAPLSVAAAALATSAATIAAAQPAPIKAAATGGKPEAATGAQTTATDDRTDTAMPVAAAAATPGATDDAGSAVTARRASVAQPAPGEPRKSDATDAAPVPARDNAARDNVAVDRVPAAPSQLQAPAGPPTADAAFVLQSAPAPAPAPATGAPAASAPPTANLTATASTTAAVPLGGLALHLATQAQSGASRFEIRLDPAELGRIDVRLDVDRHGNVTSHLTVEKPETLAMLRHDAPQLQRALNDAGLQTGQATLQFSLGDPSQSNQRSAQDGQPSPMQRIVIAEDDVPQLPPAYPYGRRSAASGGIDISV